MCSVVCVCIFLYVCSCSPFPSCFMLLKITQMNTNNLLTPQTLSSLPSFSASLSPQFGWGPDDLDKLASGSLAGHLIECGAQVTGGIFTDWQTVPDWHKIGRLLISVFLCLLITSKETGQGQQQIREKAHCSRLPKSMAIQICHNEW